MTISNDDLNTQLMNVSKLIADFSTKLAAYASGVVGGGVNSDGKYPLPTGLGSYVSVPCPAQQAADAQALVVQTGKVISLGFSSGYTAEGNNQYTFKESDKGKLFILVSNNPAASNLIKLLLPSNLSVGWNVAVIQYGDNRLSFRRSDDPNGQSNANLRNRQNFFTTAGKGSLAVAVCDSNGFFTIGGDVAA
jgi:hypothetical protein